jgi:hypothetical protein
MCLTKGSITKDESRNDLLTRNVLSPEWLFNRLRFAKPVGPLSYLQLTGSQLPSDTNLSHGSMSNRLFCAFMDSVIFQPSTNSGCWQ